MALARRSVSSAAANQENESDGTFEGHLGRGMDKLFNLVMFRRSSALSISQCCCSTGVKTTASWCARNASY